jgi:hypothetical protein
MRGRCGELIAKICAALFVIYFCMPNSQAAAEPDTRLIALVMGNSAYKGNLLPGPDNDADDMARVLSQLGFQISNAGNITNLNRVSMYSVIKTFIDQVDKDTIALLSISLSGYARVAGARGLIGGV